MLLPELLLLDLLLLVLDQQTAAFGASPASSSRTIRAKQGNAAG